ncbi:MAG: hypothetical protein MRZ79_15960 [Bacteroidia bacterium]|nr:hypothetical protein [Bacteroidia bacterium]
MNIYKSLYSVSLFFSLTILCLMLNSCAIEGLERGKTTISLTITHPVTGMPIDSVPVSVRGFSNTLLGNDAHHVADEWTDKNGEFSITFDALSSMYYELRTSNFKKKSTDPYDFIACGDKRIPIKKGEDQSFEMKTYDLIEIFWQMKPDPNLAKIDSMKFTAPLDLVGGCTSHLSKFTIYDPENEASALLDGYKVNWLTGPQTIRLEVSREGKTEIIERFLNIEKGKKNEIRIIY